MHVSVLLQIMLGMYIMIWVGGDGAALGNNKIFGIIFHGRSIIFLTHCQHTHRTNCTDVPGSKVTSFVDVPEANEMALLSAIAMQPISVAIQANQFVFQFYKTGVITDDSCGSTGSIDHGVLAVGYGTDLETQQPYFLIKNSWGATWGQDGYVKLGRKSKNKWGMCAVLKMASFPLVE